MPTGRPFQVSYNATAFDASVYPSGLLTFTADHLAHALFVTGRAPGDRVRYGFASVWEWLHRTAIIPAYIRRRTVNSRLVRSSLALELDRSEKGAISYALGQAMTGVFSEQVLLVPFLMHVDRYAHRYRATFAATRKRADLFGRRASGWVVAEAKGRSGDMPSDLQDKLVAQKRSIKSIGGIPPEVAYGCVASFPKGQYSRDSLRVDAFDPIDNEVEAIDLVVDLNQFILTYYEPFMAALAFGETGESDDIFVSALYRQFGIRLGVLRPIVNRVRQATDGELSGLYDDILQILANREEYAPFSFLDGTTIETDWEEALALNDWEYYR
ncbi:hypothetical protein EDD27_7673 [Nonomuraea polychroma]|uniref:Uncharacterized protein n=2 Tax=Nonomuraea polychroma TaxID=46176 RepID=A0A438MGX7_9ACTN|nr:hypothetical protein EDD27_7673 [Nonomuraea polychroma]